MAYLYANEPYQRVDDGILNGAVWGGVAGISTGAAILGGSYMRMKGIPASVEKTRESLQEDLNRTYQKYDRHVNNYLNRIDRYSNARLTTADNIDPSQNPRLHRRLSNSKLYNNFAKVNNQLSDLALQREQSHNARQMEKFDKKIGNIQNQLNQINDDYVKNRQKNTFYAKRLGGWKGKTALLAGSALLGAAAGGLIDYANNDIE